MGNCNVQLSGFTDHLSLLKLSKVTECKSPINAFKDLENQLVFATVITTLL